MVTLDYVDSMHYNCKTLKSFHTMKRVRGFGLIGFGMFCISACNQMQSDLVVPDMAGKLCAPVLESFSSSWPVDRVSLQQALNQLLTLGGY